jgi:multicomponent Na+:H+ antiporter subunit B
MIYVFLIFWLVSAVLVITEKKITRLIICLSVFSLVSSICFLLLAAPDVAMAEAVVSAFSTVIFIICFEKYYQLADIPHEKPKASAIVKKILPVIFTVSLAALFILFIPDAPVNTYLKDQYTSLFAQDVGGVLFCVGGDMLFGL